MLVTRGSGSFTYDFTENINDSVYARIAILGTNTDSTAIPIKIDKTPPSATSVEVKNVTKDGYDVYVYGVADTGGSGISTVRFPTWTVANGQDDLPGTWPAGTNQGNGTWYFRVNASDHNNEEGYYNTHIYIYDNAGNQATAASQNNVYVDRTPPTAPTDMQFVYGDWSRYTQGTWASQTIYAANTQSSNRSNRLNR